MQQQSDTIELRAGQGGSVLEPANNFLSDKEQNHTLGQRHTSNVENAARRSSSIGEDGDLELDVGYSVLTAVEPDGTKSKRVYQCGSCERTYERVDHVKRHVSSRMSS